MKALTGYETENSDNSLLKAVFDIDVTNEDFISMITTERESDSATFIEFMKFVNRLDLPKTSFQKAGERVTRINSIFENNIRNIA